MINAEIRARHKMTCGSSPIDMPINDTQEAVISAQTCASGPFRLSRRRASWWFRLKVTILTLSLSHQKRVNDRPADGWTGGSVCVGRRATHGDAGRSVSGRKDVVVPNHGDGLN